MYLRFSLFVLGSILLYGQSTVSPTPRTRVDDARDAIAAVQDAELLNAPLSLNDLTEEKAVQLEQAAQRQLDRAKARVQQVQIRVDAGFEPRQSLAAPLEEQAFAQQAYDLTLSRTALVHQAVEMALLEAQIPVSQPNAEEGIAGPPVMEKFAGRGSFTPADLYRVRNAFEQQFHRALPVSADGETAVHRALGFDHHDRVDVALVPDTAEGMWLRHYLEASAIPYYAFRSSVPGKATAAHIHIGPPSTHI